MVKALAVLLTVLGSATPHLTMATSASAAAAMPGAAVTLYVDVIPDPKVHVYASGAKDYLPIALELAPAPGVRADKLKYPKSQDWYFEPLKEHVPVYDVPFRLSQRVVLGRSLERGRKVTLTGVLKYQACDEAVCFNPVSAPVSWTITVK
jgi:Thiol:disulfide interchange protein DsbD, N-terminal